MSSIFEETKKTITDKEQLKRESDIKQFFLETIDDSQSMHHKIRAHFPKGVFKVDFTKLIDYVEVVPFNYNGGTISSVQLESCNQSITGFAIVEREGDENKDEQCYVMFTYDTVNKTFVRENYRINKKHEVNHTKRILNREQNCIDYTFSNEADEFLESCFADHLYFKERILPNYIPDCKKVYE